MKITFDEAKHVSNIAKHAVGFEEAARALLDPNRFDSLDDRKDYGEARRVALGEVQGRVFVVVYTVRGDVFRTPLKVQISSQLLRCGKNFLLTYQTYAALRNFFRALHLGELCIFRGAL